MPTTTRDQLIADAKDVPSLIASAETRDPALAQALTGKALIASRTPWGTLLGGVLAWGVAKYGLAWDDATTSLVAGLGVLAGSYVMRWISASPITGLFTHAAPAAALVLLVAGCATANNGPTPKAVVLSMESGLTATDGLAVQYVRLAQCTGINRPLCSEPAIVMQIKAKAQAAHDALAAAQAAADADPSGNSSATQAAVTDARVAFAAFNSAVSILPAGAKK